MLFKTVIFTVLLVFVAANPYPPNAIRVSEPQQLISIMYLEEPCVRQGGMCTLISQCPPENLVQIRGVLCPKQSHLDVECCYI